MKKVTKIVIDERKQEMKKITKIITGCVVGLIALIVVLDCFCMVQAGHTGVITTFGKVSENVLSEGLHLKIPFVQQIIQVDNRVLKAEVSSSSASKDLQTVSSTIALNYRVNKLSSASVYRELGMDFENKIVNPAIQECVKSVTAKFTAEELITNRQAVSDQMRESISEKINPYGLTVEVFNIISFDFSAEFNAAIEAKQTAQQNALKAEQDLARIKVEAEQTIEQAKAEAEAYRLKNEQLTQQLIMMEYINKWDGRLPAVMSDGTNIFDIGGIIEDYENTPAVTAPTYPSYPTYTEPTE